MRDESEEKGGCRARGCMVMSRRRQDRDRKKHI
jgi:hypothetical protein